MLNYGVKEVAGGFAAKDRVQLIRKSIAQAIEAYEPRIRKGSVQVEMRSENVSRNTVISFDIRADMWAEPIPIELYLRSSIDVTTGQVALERGNGASRCSKVCTGTTTIPRLSVGNACNADSRCETMSGCGLNTS